MSTYGIARLLDEYHPGSRQWLYNKVNAWLEACDAAMRRYAGPVGGSGGVGNVPEGPAAGQPSRMFMLLADAGMGKSVFSAVMHTKLTVEANREGRLALVCVCVCMCPRACARWHAAASISAF
jgi:hypothetical protein